MIAHFIYGLHPILLGAFVLSGCVATAILLVLVHRRFVKIMNPDAVDFRINIETYSDAFGVATSILLSLIIVSEWGSYNHVSHAMNNELYALDDLYKFSTYYDEETKIEIRNNLTKYVDAVIEEEWPLLAYGEKGEKAENYLFNNYNFIHKNKIENKNQEQLHITIKKTLEQIIENRRIRLFNSEAILSPIMWIVTLSCIFISFMILSFTTRGATQFSLFFQSLFSFGIGLLLLLIIVLNKPFYYGVYYDGDMSVKSFKNLLKTWREREQ